VKYQPNTTQGQDFETGDSLNGWQCLRFSLNQATYYQHHYHLGGGAVATMPGAPALAGNNSFEAAAQGNLDNDLVVSTFARSGTVNTTTGQLILATQVFIDNEFE
jgi:type IV pilus assembly protein PilA